MSGPPAVQLALLLTGAARHAVKCRVGERVYIDLARSLYRSIAGPPRMGPAPASHGAWDPILAATGGQSALARLLGVARKTVQRWVTGATKPSEGDVAKLRRLAARYRVDDPV